VAERLGRGALGALSTRCAARGLAREEALRQLTRYGRLTHDLARFELIEGKGEIHLTLDIPGSPTPTPAAQFFLAAPLALFRDCVAGGISPREVHFVHTDPGGGSAAEYGRVLGAPVRFGVNRHAIVLDAGQLALPFVEADAVLGRILDQHLERALAALPAMATDSFPAQVRRVLADSLASAEPSAEVVATRLRVSVRTLNRRLAAEGESLRGLRDAVRHELAVAQLGDPRLAIGEVAFLLGFSESSAFYRWFRRVEGVSPGAFRRGRATTGPTPGEASRP
jgi:AraC-like DNA-binding protein